MRLHALETIRRTFRSLANRNYRIFIVGQVISLSGTWMQSVAQAWLVLRLTGSGTALGLVVALQFLPVLLFGPFGGVIADRFPKRRLLLATQTVAMTQALVLGLLVITGTVELWMVFAMAAVFGLVTAVDNPARQTFVLEMVGPANLTNAITLNSVVVNAARVVGPALAGVLIAVVGIGICFVLNAASYVAVILALLLMRTSDLNPAPTQERAKGQLREGFAYVRRTPDLLIPLLMMAIIGTLSYEFQVILPLVAERTFGGGAGTYGTLTSAMGVGAVVGGLATAGRSGAPSHTALVRAAALFGSVILLAALAPFLWLEVVVLVLVGAASINVLATGNTTLQLRAAPELRGRVMALWAVAFLGTTPVGGPIIGYIGEHAGPRVGLAVGGSAALVAAVVGWWFLVRPAAGGEPGDDGGGEVRTDRLVAAAAPAGR
jgi:MFS family permease